MVQVHKEDLQRHDWCHWVQLWQETRQGRGYELLSGLCLSTSTTVEEGYLLVTGGMHGEGENKIDKQNMYTKRTT